MNENLKAFLKKLAGDKDLQAKFSSVKSVQEAYEIAAGFSMAEFEECMKKFTPANGDLSDADLKSVAGGVGLSTIKNSVSEVTSYVNAASKAAI